MEFKLTVFKLNQYLKELDRVNFPIDKVGDNLYSVLKFKYTDTETKIILSMLLFYLDYCKWSHNSDYRIRFLSPAIESLKKYLKEVL